MSAYDAIMEMDEQRAVKELTLFQMSPLAEKPNLVPYDRSSMKFDIDLLPTKLRRINTEAYRPYAHWLQTTHVAGPM